MRKSALVAAVLAFSTLNQAHAKSLISTGGSCSSQGPWTTKALENSKLILQTAEQLKNDPDCKVLADAIQKVNSAALYQELEKDSKLNGPGSKYEGLPGELMSLRTILLENANNSQLTSRLTPVLAKSTVDVAANNASLWGALTNDELTSIRERMKRTRVTGEALLSAVFTSLPQGQQCLHKSKNMESGLTILAASIRMMSAFASGSETSGHNIAALIGQFNNFLREMKYAKIINELNIQQFWTEMSCLIETTQASYCNAKDGLQLLSYQAKEAEILAELRDNIAKGKVGRDSAIEGYLLLGREVQGINQWLQRVQSGIEAKTINDANVKNDIWNTVLGLTQSINLLQGQYNENLQIYRVLPTLEQKQQNIRVLLRSLANTIIRQNTKINFFTLAVQDDLIPFYLIGRTQIPDEVLGRNGTVPMDAWKYMQDSGRTAELNNPDAAMATIIERLSSLSELALREGSKYFAQNMSVDHINLVDETFTDSSVTVHDSLKNVRNYIARLAVKYARSNGDARRLTLSMSETVSRLDKVLKKFDELGKLANQFNVKVTAGNLKIEDFNNLTKEQQDKVKGLYKELIATVYDEFNLLLQKDAFIAQRLSTYVRFDLFQRLRTKEDMSPYMQYLLVASGRNILNRFQAFQNFNAAEIEADLAEAQRINRANLEQVEELFAGDVWTYINKLSQETGNEYVKRYTDNPFRPMYKLITDFHNVTWQQLSHLPGYSSRRRNQDEDGSLAFLRAKMCTQTLGFKNWIHFQHICQGALLQSRMTAKAPKELRLQFSYPEMIKEKGYSTWDKFRESFGGAPPEGKRYQHVCALRDFFRNNQVYWLTLEFGQNHQDDQAANAPAPEGAPDPFR